MKIAVIGGGNVGRTLGKKWQERNHEVIFGVRDPGSAKVRKLVQEMGKAVMLLSIPDALERGEVILLSVPWGAVREIVTANRTRMEGKLVIDPTNRFEGPVISNIETIQKAIPTASVYRAFNSLGYKLFAQPVVTEFGDPFSTDHFFTGEDGKNRGVMEGLISDIGMLPVWVGENEKVNVVDELGVLWITLIRRPEYNDRISFKLVNHNQ